MNVPSKMLFIFSAAKTRFSGLLIWYMLWTLMNKDYQCHSQLFQSPRDGNIQWTLTCKSSYKSISWKTLVFRYYFFIHLHHLIQLCKKQVDNIRSCLTNIRSMNVVLLTFSICTCVQHNSILPMNSPYHNSLLILESLKAILCCCRENDLTIWFVDHFKQVSHQLFLSHRQTKRHWQI